jgi:hypothetical protein
MSKSIVIGCILGLLVPVAIAQESPPIFDFYYCGEFYRWYENELSPKSPIKSEMTNSMKMFKAGAAILSGGSTDFALLDKANATFNADLRKAVAEEARRGVFAAPIGADCWSKQRRYTKTIVRKAAEIGQAERPFFSHMLPNGRVDALLVEEHLATLRAVPTVSVDDQKEMIIYSFSKQFGAATESVHHVFTKPDHPAHPAVLFLSKRREPQGKPAPLFVQGSYAGSEKEFALMQEVLFMVNQGL